jgi:hypothetical protein
LDVVVDDHILLRVLLGDEPPDLREGGGRVVTTGLWYHRLCRAVAVPAVVGALSRALGGVAPEAGAAALRAVTSLPEAVTLVSMRELAWPMSLLFSAGVRLNLMSLEALAAAEHLDAHLCLATTDDNPPLRRAAETRGKAVRMISA